MKIISQIAVVVSCAVTAVGANADDFPAAPGIMYDIGGYELHLYCKGTGKPTVLIDSGIGDVSLTWHHVQERLSQHTKTCIYDRAGYGFSDPGPLPRTTKRIVKELKKLTNAAQLPSPFVLIGHSFGGYNVRYFTSQYPHDVAALVLVDSAHPDQHKIFPVRQRDLSCRMFRNLKCQRIVRPVIPQNLPDDLRLMVTTLMVSLKQRITYLRELESFEESGKQIQRAAKLPDLPIVVISRGKRVWPSTPEGSAKEAAWERMQADLGMLTPHTTRIIDPKSGHQIHLDNPDFIADAALAMVIDARTAQPGIEIMEYFAKR